MKKITAFITMPVVFALLLLAACVSQSSTVKTVKEEQAEQVPGLVEEVTTGIVPEQAFFYTDAENGGSSQNEGTYADGRFILTGTVTTQFQYGFIGGGFDLDAGIKDLLQAAKGIKFKTKGDGKNYRCRLCSQKVKDYDYHGYVFNAGKVENEVMILYGDATQEGWGTSVMFDKMDIFQISFQTVGQPYESVSLEVYDMEIIPEN